MKIIFNASKGNFSMQVQLNVKGEAVISSTAVYEVDESAFNDLISEGATAEEALDTMRSNPQQYNVETISSSNEADEIIDVYETVVSVVESVSDDELKSFHVRLNIQIGEASKSSDKFLLAADEDAAGKMAIENEAHSDLDWDGGGAYDLGGELHYSVSRVTELPKDLYDNIKYAMGGAPKPKITQ